MFLFNFIRLGDDAPAPAGTYVHVGELIDALRRQEYDGAEEVATWLEPLNEASPSERVEVLHYESARGKGITQVRRLLNYAGHCDAPTCHLQCRFKVYFSEGRGSLLLCPKHKDETLRNYKQEGMRDSV